MPVSSILQLASDKFTEVLADDVNGFNPLLASVWASRSLEGSSFTIDYSHDASATFFTSDFSAPELFEDDNATLPAQCLFESAAENSNLLIPINAFSGEVELVLVQHLLWPGGSIARGFNQVRFAVFDTLMSLLMSDFAASVLAPSQVFWGGRVAMEAGQLMFANVEDGVWMQSIRYPMRFTVNT